MGWSSGSTRFLQLSDYDVNHKCKIRGFPYFLWISLPFFRHASILAERVAQYEDSALKFFSRLYTSIHSSIFQRRPKIFIRGCAAPALMRVPVAVGAKSQNS